MARPEKQEELILDRFSRLSELRSLQECRDILRIPGNSHPLHVRHQLRKAITNIGDDTLAGMMVIAGGLITQLQHEGYVIRGVSIEQLEEVIEGNLGLFIE